MNKPILDPRTKEDLMALIKRRAGEYTPDWRYEHGNDDPGGAIASLFGELFYQTIDRYNLLPQKYYTEFLNLLGVLSPGVTSACGLMQFEQGGVDGTPVAIPQGTEVFAAAPSELDEDIVFATQRKIEVTTAKLLDIHYVDPQQGRIERLDLSQEQPFFAPTGGENLQRHRFAISQDDVLALGGACTVTIFLSQSAHFLEESTAKRLSDTTLVSWLYFNSQCFVKFDSVRHDGGAIVLEKLNDDDIMPEEDGHRYVYCQVHSGTQGGITLSGVDIKSAIAAPVALDAMIHNDVPIPSGDGGYCFGRRPAPYDMFYLRSDNVFCKRGARVSVKLDIIPITYSGVGGEPQYEFNKRIIDKNDAVRVVAEDVFVEQVIWEYYNGLGWARLEVSGNTNPFSCKQTGDLIVIFTVPKDMAKAVVGAEEGCFIRARVVNVENFFSTIPRWILPFVRFAQCDFQYDKGIPADVIRAENNARTTTIADAAAITDLNMTVFEPMQPCPRAMYLRFDASPHAMPLSILFDVVGENMLSSKILYEMGLRDGFRQVRSIDQTDNLRFAGMTFLYLTQPLEQIELFGQTGYYVRMSLSAFAQEDNRVPHVAGVRFNIVNAIQRQKAAPQLFNTGAYEAGKVLELIEKPVLDVDVWIDEISEISTAKAEEMERDDPENVRLERDGNTIAHCYVHWKQVEALSKANPYERVYALDAFQGLIMFGSDTDGRVPPAGEQNIRVEYSYGGGARGNVKQGSVDALVGSIPRINSVSNIVPMSGGTDRPPMAKTEELGNKRIRHRDRALGASDFEQMAMAHFERLAHVKCFQNTDRAGHKASGHVCLVIMGRDFSTERMTMELCRDIYEYISQRADCNLVADGRLHVTPSTEITVNVQAQVDMRDLDQAAVTQQQLIDNIAKLIDHTWRGREIGRQIDLLELYQVIKATPNISAVRQVLCEGSYFADGRRKLCALEENEFPFATVKSGTHTIRIV